MIVFSFLTLFAIGPCFVLFLLFALGINGGRFSECVVFISFSSPAFLSCPFPMIFQNQCLFLGLLYLINTETGLIHGNCIVHITFITFLPPGFLYSHSSFFPTGLFFKNFPFDVLRYFGAYSFIKTHFFTFPFPFFPFVILLFSRDGER